MCCWMSCTRPLCCVQQEQSSLCAFTTANFLSFRHHDQQWHDRLNAFCVALTSAMRDEVESHKMQFVLLDVIYSTLVQCATRKNPLLAAIRLLPCLSYRQHTTNAAFRVTGCHFLDPWAMCNTRNLPVSPILLPCCLPYQQQAQQLHDDWNAIFGARPRRWFKKYLQLLGCNM